MKYSILGYSQSRLLELGLGMDEAMLLRWFVEYQATGKMRSMMIEGRSFTWINFSGVLNDIPIIGGSPKTMSRRFNRLEEAGVLEHRTVREGGVYSYFRICESVYLSLLDDSSKRVGKQPSNMREDRTNLSNGRDGCICVQPLENDGLLVPEGKSQQKKGETTPEGWTNLSNGPSEMGKDETELSEGETELSDRWTKVSEQMTHTQDTYTRQEKIPPIAPQESGQQAGGKRANSKISIPQEITGVYRKALENFMAFRVEIGFPMTPRAMELTIGKLATLETDAGRVACIERSIECRYRGVFPESVRNVGNAGIGAGKPSQRNLGSEDAWEDYYKSHGKEARR